MCDRSVKACELGSNPRLGALKKDQYNYSMSGGHFDYKQYRIDDIVQEIEVPYGQEYLSLLVRQGKIAGYKEGRNWLTTVEAVREYMNR